MVRSHVPSMRHTSSEPLSPPMQQGPFFATERGR